MTCLEPLTVFVLFGSLRCRCKCLILVGSLGTLAPSVRITAAILLVFSIWLGVSHLLHTVFMLFSQISVTQKRKLNKNHQIHPPSIPHSKLAKLAYPAFLMNISTLTIAISLHPHVRPPSVPPALNLFDQLQFTGEIFFVHRS